MSLPIVLLIIVGALILLLVGLLVAANLSANIGDKETRRIRALVPQRKVEKKGFGGAISKFFSTMSWLKMYDVVDRFLILSEIQQSTKERFSNLYVGEANEVNARAAKSTTIATLIFFVFVSFAVFAAKNMYSVASFIAAGLFTFSLWLDHQVNAAKLKGLYAQDSLLDALLDSYSDTGSVRTSFSHLKESLPPASAIHAEKFDNILSAEDPSVELITYFESAPNQYMKQLAELSYSVMEYGDADDDSGVNGYRAGVRRIQDDLRRWIVNGEKTRRALSGSPLLVIIPVFLVEPARNFVSGMMPELASFFDSVVGFVCTIIIYFTFIVSFFGLRFMMNMNNTETKTLNEGRFYNWLLSFKFVASRMRNFAPTHKQTVRSVNIVNKSEKILTESNSSMSIHQLYLAKWTWTFLTFIISLIVLQNTVVLAKVAIEDKKAYTIDARTSVANIDKQRRIFESETVLALSNRKLTDDQLTSAVRSLSEDKRFVLQGGDLDTYVIKLVNKIKLYESMKFQWYYVLICAIIGLLGYLIPGGMLLLRASVRKWDMHMEVAGFNSILFILHTMKHVTVYDIVEWIHRYSSIFKKPLSDLLSNYHSGPEEAFETFKEEVRFAPLVRIADRLQKSTNSIEIQDAFSNLTADRQFEIEKQQLEVERTIANKKVLADIFGNSPAVVLVLLYLLLPFGFMMYDLFVGSNATMNSTGG
jgi:hypothetical protein